MIEQEAYALGLRDGLSQLACSPEIAWGMSWPNLKLNEAYDRGLNKAEEAHEYTRTTS